MPQATPELQAKFPGMDVEAWEALTTNYDEHRFLIYPKVVGYKPTERESDAIDYLIQEWDWDYDAEWLVKEHERKMKIVHAVWLIHYLHEKRLKTAPAKVPTEAVLDDVAALFGVAVDELFVGFDHDYLDRAWCSRPNDWKPQDSLAQVKYAD